MGYSISLLAVQCADPDRTLSALEITRSGQTCKYAKERLSGCALPGNWFLIVAQGCANPFLKPKILGLLSEQSALVACSIEEHVMFSSAEYWAGGALVWRVEHVGENGPVHLRTSGDLPSDFAGMAAVQMKRQEADGGKEADVDHYFDIPLNLARSIMGFKHDEEIPGVDYDNFELLSKTTKSKVGRSWWQIWK